MKGRFFRTAGSYDNPVFSRLAVFFDLIILNFLWVAASLPIVTAGSASTALYYTVVKNIRRERSSMLRCYLSCLRRELARGCCLTAVLLIVFGFLFIDYYCYPVLGAGTPAGYVYLTLVTGMWVTALLTLPYVFPLLSRYRLGVVGCLKNAVLLSLRHLPSSIAMAALLVLCVWLILLVPYLLFLLPAPVCLLCSYLLERIFHALLPHDEGSDTEDVPKWYEE